MKVQFITSPEGFEISNYILEMALDNLRNNEELKKQLDVTDYDIYLASIFRKQLVKGFASSLKKNKELTYGKPQREAGYF